MRFPSFPKERFQSANMIANGHPRQGCNHGRGGEEKRGSWTQWQPTASSPPDIYSHQTLRAATAEFANTAMDLEWPHPYLPTPPHTGTSIHIPPIHPAWVLSITPRTLGVWRRHPHIKVDGVPARPGPLALDNECCPDINVSRAVEMYNREIRPRLVAPW